MNPYIAYLRRSQGGAYSVGFPDLPGCATSARTIEEAMAGAAEVLADHMRNLHRLGCPIAPPSSLDQIFDDPLRGDAVILFITIPPDFSNYQEEWYAVKGLFRWHFKDNNETARVEERIVLFKADNCDDALDLAEKEAEKYCIEDLSANYRIESMGWWNSYRPSDEPSHGTEIYSRLMRTSLPCESFLRRYCPRSHDDRSR